MKFRIIYQQSSNNAQSPIRVIEQTSGQEIGWINRYLDREYVRRLAHTSLRAYAYHLLHFVRWWASIHHTGNIEEQDLSESTVGLMLLHGLRSAEVLALNGEDVLLPEAQLRVRGKGNKLRFLPLAPETIQLLDHYLQLERPSPCSAALFVVLKGRARGTRMNAAGLRSLFRHHRQTTGIKLAHPHRFRHTFASDMVRAGMSLPALMRLMGHADIQTTLQYVQITPQDVYLEYARAVAQHIRPLPKISL